LITYAPNLWRVFLTYAQDAVGKVTALRSILIELFPCCMAIDFFLLTISFHISFESSSHIYISSFNTGSGYQRTISGARTSK
jgi:hypothetical protein